MTEYSAEAQAAWEAQVRNELVQLGFDPDEVEADNEGFGQDFMEYSNDAAGFARLLVESEDDTNDAQS